MLRCWQEEHTSDINLEKRLEAWEWDMADMDMAGLVRTEWDINMDHITEADILHITHRHSCLADKTITDTRIKHKRATNAHLSMAVTKPVKKWTTLTASTFSTANVTFVLHRVIAQLSSVEYFPKCPVINR